MLIKRSAALAVAAGLVAVGCATAGDGASSTLRTTPTMQRDEVDASGADRASAAPLREARGEEEESDEPCEHEGDVGADDEAIDGAGEGAEEGAESEANDEVAEIDDDELRRIAASIAAAHDGAARPDSYEPTRASLRTWQTPQWFEDEFLGIYVHWGPYSVPGFAFLDPSERVDSGIWYGGEMYDPQTPTGVYDHHVATYGDPEVFGYHDLIERFTAENWDPARWVELCKNAGCGFIGIGAEHGDGYPMWDTEHDSINAVTTGPRRDLLGDIFAAARAADLKTIATVHEHPGSTFGGVLESVPADSHRRDPQYADLYQADTPEVYEAKMYELIAEYQPDQLWIDNPILQRDGDTWMRFVADYYSRAELWGNGGALIAQKAPDEFLMEHTTFDIEGGEFPGGVWEWRGMTEPFPLRWQKDVPLGNYWAYAEGVGARPTNLLVDGIVDRVAKNGVTLLNLAPKEDGTLPAEQVRALEELAQWMALNEEALHGARPAPYHPGGVDAWQANDGQVRFTEKGDHLYAIELGNSWPPTVGFADAADSTPPSGPYRLPGVAPVVGSQITMLGSDTSLPWRIDDDLVIEQLPDTLPGDHAWTFKIQVRGEPR